MTTIIQQHSIERYYRCSLESKILKFWGRSCGIRCIHLFTLHCMIMILSSLLWVGKNFRRMYQIVPPSIYTLQRLPLQLLVGRVFYLVLLLNWYLAVLRSHKVTWGIVFTPIIFISVYFGTYSVQKICCRRVARLRLSTQFLENK